MSVVSNSNKSPIGHIAVAAALLLLQVSVLLYYGQPLICACGYVKIWEGDVWSSGMSQHLFDWYSFTHVLHGFLFYFVLWLLFPKTPVITRLLLALGIEVGWEILENSQWVIHRYREQALAAGYSGDSILNSLSDSLTMLFGLLLAWRLPVWIVVTMAVAMEIFLGFAIHDNLTLNIINLIYPLDFLRAWQSSVR